MKITLVPLLLGCLSFVTGCATNTATNKPASTPVKSSAWPWPASMDAVVAAPKNHKVLYEDDRIRILDVTVLPSEKENVHDHPWPSVLIIDYPRKIRDTYSDGTVVERDSPSPQTPIPIVERMAPQPPHSVENLDTETMHLYRVELKKTEFKN